MFMISVLLPETFHRTFAKPVIKERRFSRRVLYCIVFSFIARAVWLFDV